MGGPAGMRLATPAGCGTRPTSDRVREALFSRLEHLEVLVGARVVDLYAGSGALGLEAASRGAATVLLVESDKAAAKVTRAERATPSAYPGPRCGTPPCSGAGDATGRAADAGLPRPAVRPQRGGARRGPLALLDEQAGSPPTRSWSSSGRPAPRSRRWPEDLEREGERRYGETKIWFAGPRLPDVVA